MKPIYSYALLAAFAAVGQALAVDATTIPVGYVTETLAPNRDNLIGLTMHQPVLASGVLDSSTSSSVTDAAVDFSALLASGSTYILEITGGTGDGIIQEVTAWGTNTLTTQDLTGVVVNNVTTYKIRKAPTISEVFGANTPGLSVSTDLTTTTADVILVPDGGGGFNSIFYYNDGVDQLWLNSALEDVGTFPLIYTDGIIVARKAGSPVDLVISGEVKKTKTTYVVAPGDNYLGMVYPVGAQLADSGVGPQLNPSTDLTTTTADVLLFPDGSGGFNQYFYYNDGVDALWLNSALEDSAAAPYTSGFILGSKSGASKNVTASIPTTPNYSTL